MALRDDQVQETIEMLKDHFLSKLTPWECDFLESIESQWEAYARLSDRQREVLDQIAERCARGHGR